MAGIDAPGGRRSSSTAPRSATATGSRRRPPREAARLLARTEGILVDPVYTAKALAGLIDRVRAGVFDGQRVVFWHGGGLPAIFEDLTASA